MPVVVNHVTGGTITAVDINAIGTLLNAVEITANGAVSSTGNVGFYGTVPIAKQSLTYSRTGEPASTAAIRVALAALGLVTDATVA